MSQRYIAFDVETPNARNDRISAIGITVIADGAVVEYFCSLVNPEVEFDPFNVQLTGIAPEMVLDKPTFKELWETLEPILDSGLLIAHNAPFDMSVLAKCLEAYHIQWHPYTYYACTCAIARKYYNNVPNHRLNTMCDHFNIALDHHNAGSDSLACANLLLQYMNDGVIVDEFIKSYDLLSRSTQKKAHKTQLSVQTTQLLELKDVLAEITEDGVLNEREVIQLQNWMEQNASLRGNFPYDKIFNTVEAALEDGVLDPVELQQMFLLFDKITDPVANSCGCDSFNIAGKTFCLTGEFNYGSRSQVEVALVAKGGIPVKSVTKKTNYVIVGSQGSDAWSSGNYGSKIKKALELKDKGITIDIVKESDIDI